MDAFEGVEFLPLEERQRPAAGEMPEEVSRFVQLLSRLTGLAATPPQTISLESRDSAFFGKRFRSAFPISKHMSTTPIRHQTTTRTFKSLDEVPPELRAQVEEALAQGRQGKILESQRITITQTDAQGETVRRTYHSPEEMPPEVRAMWEQMRKQARDE